MKNKLVLSSTHFEELIIFHVCPSNFYQTSLLCNYRLIKMVLWHANSFRVNLYRTVQESCPYDVHIYISCVDISKWYFYALGPVEYE